MSEAARSTLDEVIGSLNLPERGEEAGRHPMGSDFSLGRDPRVHLMAPDDIREEGVYIRRWFQDDDFDRFCASVAATGEVEQPIGVRVVGPPTDSRYVLVYGMRRRRAALKAGLATVPVRNYGRISEEQAVALQMIENEFRQDPHPVDTAYGYWLLSQSGLERADIVQQYGVRKGPLSEYVRVGAALDLMEESERALLYESPDITVRAFQEIAKLSTPAARKKELLRLARGQNTAVRQAVDRRRKNPGGAPFHAQAHRDGGRTFRLRWRDEHLREAPLAFAVELRERLSAEADHIARRLATLAQGASDEGSAETARALRQAEAEVRRLTGSET